MMDLGFQEQLWALSPRLPACPTEGLWEKSNAAQTKKRSLHTLPAPTLPTQKGKQFSIVMYLSPKPADL